MVIFVETVCKCQTSVWAFPITGPGPAGRCASVVCLLASLMLVLKRYFLFMLYDD